MEIKEALMSKSFSVMHEDPYLMALRVMEAVAQSEKVIEKKNTYESDGPHHRCNVAFDAVEDVDDFAKIIFNFDMTGANGLLRVKVSGGMNLHIDETGFFSNGFADHYANNIFPLLRKISEDKIGFFGNKLDEIFKQEN